MPDVFGVASNTLSITHSLNDYTLSCSVTYLGPHTHSSIGSRIYLGPNYFPNISTTNSVVSTNTKSLSGYLYPPFLKQVARELISGSIVGQGSEHSTSFIHYVFPSFLKQSARELISGSIVGQGSETNNLQQLPIVYLGPYYGPQEWIGYSGYYRFLNSYIVRSLTSSLSLTQSLSEIHEIPRSLTQSLTITHSVVGEVWRQLSQTITITDSVVDVEEYSRSLSHSLSLTDQALNVSDQHLTDTLSLTNSIDLLSDFIRSISSTLVLTHVAGYNADYSLTIIDTLLLTQSTLGPKEHPESLSDTLSLTDTPVIDTISKNVISTLTITQGVTPKFGRIRNLSHALLTSQNVAHNFKYTSASNTISLTHSVHNSILTIRDANSLLLTQTADFVTNHYYLSNTLTLTDIVVKQGPVFATAEDDLILDDRTGYGIDHYYVDTLLTFEEIVRPSIISERLEHTIGINHEYIYVPTQIYILSLSDTIILEHHSLTLSGLVASNDLELTDSFTFTGPIYVDVTDDLFIGDILDFPGSDFTITVTDNLALTDTANIVLPQQDLTQTITLAQAVRNSKGYQHDLNITQDFDFELSKDIIQDIGINDLLVLHIVKLEDIVDTLNLGQSVIPAIINRIDLCRYSPYGVAPTIPTYSRRSTIIITYPYVSPSLTLELRIPNYEDTEIDSYKRIIRTSRGGTQRVYRQTAWPKSKRLTYTISFNRNQKIEDFVTFIETSAGQEIGLLDYNSRQWRGIIQIPEDVFTFVSKSNRQIQFDFEGELA